MALLAFFLYESRKIHLKSQPIEEDNLDHINLHKFFLHNQCDTKFKYGYTIIHHASNPTSTMVHSERLSLFDCVNGWG